MHQIRQTFVHSQEATPVYVCWAADRAEWAFTQSRADAHDFGNTLEASEMCLELEHRTPEAFFLVENHDCRFWTYV